MLDATSLESRSMCEDYQVALTNLCIPMKYDLFVELAFQLPKKLVNIVAQ